MFRVTNAAKTELQNRLNSSDKNSLMIRLQMRKSCFLKVKLTLEDLIQPNDTEVILDGLHFIIDQGECHYFNHKTLDFLPDTTGYKQFEVLN
ncbi:iron-sulfur cluster biosynthesis [Bacillus sp. MUM 116]|uniref:iron-sulfur cluster biosynthesis n=1 Tax=Bacillus sp. MUM 116 TaxID=1678002 RepID=UPI0008F5967E|nr:iron-sulfur cluster biosynthesis [Bacillus sp. MUM 116]OIK10729.1 iron-sulfur cluster biosynthesis [Bacillus sp. MUM 116]